MDLFANSLNGKYMEDIVRLADQDELEQIDLAVAYVLKMDSLFDLADRRDVPLNLYALVDGAGFPHLGVLRKFLETSRVSWRLFLTRDFFHPKILWFRGVGAYVGSANLTDKAWYQNQECGIWTPKDELERLNWTEELASIFSAVQARCREATAEDLKALKDLQSRRRSLSQEEKSYQKQVDQLLGHLPGNHPPIDQTRRREVGGAAKVAFLEEWNQGLTLLRKITRVFADNKARWPAWLDQDVHPAIVQDQATEWFWDFQFRRTRASVKNMLAAHERNLRDPDAAVREMLDGWCEFDGGDSGSPWRRFMNETPSELHRLLSQEGLASLDVDMLTGIISMSHAAREHGRQIRNEDLGLPPDAKHTQEERCEIFARYLWGKRSKGGRTVRQVLEYVIWGDKQKMRGIAPDVAERNWLAAHDDEWKLPHLGKHILGELIGYARPDEFPPRNNRVSKTLFALGFPDITYQ